MDIILNDEKEIEVIDDSGLSEKEISDIVDNIEFIINTYKNNSFDLETAAFMGISALERSDYEIKEDGKKTPSERLKKILRISTYDNTDSKLYKAYYGSINFLIKIIDRNLISFERLTAIENRIKYSTYQSLYKTETFNSDLSEYINIKKKEILNAGEKIEDIRENVAVIRWINSLENKTFDDISYDNLNDFEKVACLIRDFYDITGGEWNIADIVLLKNAAKQVGIQINNGIKYFDFIKYIATNREIQDKFINEDLNRFNSDKYKNAMIIRAIAKVNSFETKEDYIINTFVDSMKDVCDEDIDMATDEISDALAYNYISSTNNIDMDQEISIFDFMVELLFNIRTFEYAICKEYREENIDFIEEYIKFINYHIKTDEKLGDEFRDTAVENITKYAERGNVKSQRTLGNIYKKEYNYEEAFKWYRKAALGGDDISQYNLGYLYYKGLGTYKDYEKSFEWYRESAEKGNINSQYNLGYMYEKGLGKPRNPERAFDWYYKSAKGGDSSAQYNLGHLYLQGKGVEKNLENALKWFMESAKQGNSKAMNNIGYMYETGKGVYIDYGKAFDWYERSAEKGNIRAIYNLGYMYHNGRGTEKNLERAFECYKYSAYKGYARAQYEIGKMYENGEAVSQNNEEAFKWYEKAAIEGNNKAECALAYLYEMGNGVEKNLEKAIEWYKKSIKYKNNAIALNRLGHIMEDKGDDIKAFNYYKKSANEGNAESRYKMGCMYYEGRVVEKNYAKALECFKKASKENISEAQVMIGKMYYFAEGVNVDYKKAVIYYKKAAAAGNKEAEEFLKQKLVNA